MNDEQKQAIYNVLLEYFESRHHGYKINLHIEYMADRFPDITKEVVKDLKRKLLLKVGNRVSIGMMCNPAFNIVGEIIKIGKSLIKVKLNNDEIIEFYTSSLNQKGWRDKNYSNVLFIRLDIYF